MADQIAGFDRENRLRTVIESVPNGIIMVDREGRIVLCNSETERLFGYDRDELINKTIEILVPERFRARHPGFRNAFIAEPTQRQMGAGRDLSGVRKDGSEIPVEIGLNHMNVDGTNYIIASVVDITERKRQEERFRTIVESVPNGIVMVDQSGNIVMSNSELERMFGYERGELLGKPVETLVPMRYRPDHPAHRNKFIKQPQKRQMGAGRDLTGQRKDGTEIPVEIGLNPVQTGAGNFVLASILDITERKRIEVQLQHAYEEVQQKNIEMEQFVYTVSHDLKSPLVTSMSFIGFIKEDLSEQNMEAVMESLDRLDKAHKRMQGLINDLLQLSRVGRMQLEQEKVDLKELLTGIVDYLGDKLKASKLKVELSPTLPVLFVDRKRITQVFENLLNNAVKYASEVPDPRVQIFSKETDKEIQICVKDNGPGIDPQYHSKIFGLFQRLNADKEGTGVGLAIVARVMQLHNGRTWVESQVGHGAEFWIAFPKPSLEGETGHVH